jgi:predicted DNA-binding transcriptional regulator YafY
LAERLEVSERTIYRDLDALSVAGVPVYAERGVGGGWFLPEEYRATLPAMSIEEMQALMLVNPQRLLADLGLQQVAENAMTKLVAGLPARSRQNAVQAWQRLHVDFSGWNKSAEAIPLLPILQQAVWQDRKLQICYQRAGGENVERLVEPMGLVAKGNVWYLVAMVDGETRTYRVSRVLEARLTHEEFVRSESFDLAQYWAQAETDFRERLPRYPLLLRAHPTVVPRLQYAGRFSRVEETGAPEEDDWVVVRMAFQAQEDRIAFALSLGPLIEVIEPMEVREEAIRLMEETLALYAKRAG